MSAAPLPRTRLTARVSSGLAADGRDYARRWNIPLGVIVASALAEFLERRRDTDVGPLPNVARNRRGPPSRAEALTAAAALVDASTRGGRPPRP